MFIRCEFHQLSQKIELIDEDFRCLLNPPYNITENNKHTVELSTFINEYRSRDKNIGQNLALFINWYYKKEGVAIRRTVDWLKVEAPKSIYDWPSIERSMESYLKLLMVWC